MKFVIIALAAGILLGLAACSTVTATSGSGQQPAASSVPAQTATPAPTVTKTVTPRQVPGSQPPATAPSPVATVPNVTDPWAVVSAYYGDIESGNYREAWALLSSGAVTGQTYQQFVDGFSCTGSQQVTDLGESGDQVSFDLAATDSCTGAVQHFTGTDTVQDGKIVAANVSQTG